MRTKERHQFLFQKFDPANGCSRSVWQKPFQNTFCMNLKHPGGLQCRNLKSTHFFCFGGRWILRLFRNSGFNPSGSKNQETESLQQKHSSVQSVLVWKWNQFFNEEGKTRLHAVPLFGVECWSHGQRNFDSTPFNLKTRLWKHTPSIWTLLSIFGLVNRVNCMSEHPYKHESLVTTLNWTHWCLWNCGCFVFLLFCTDLFFRGSFSRRVCERNRPVWRLSLVGGVRPLHLEPYSRPCCVPQVLLLPRPGPPNTGGSHLIRTQSKQSRD